MTWALRSLCRPSTKAHLLTTGQGPMVVLPGGSCVLSGGGSAGGVHPLPEYTSRRQRRLVHRAELPDALGAWGPSATNKLRRVYTGALLAITVRAYKKGLNVIRIGAILCSCQFDKV